MENTMGGNIPYEITSMLAKEMRTDSVSNKSVKAQIATAEKLKTNSEVSSVSFVSNNVVNEPTNNVVNKSNEASHPVVEKKVGMCLLEYDDAKAKDKPKVRESKAVLISADRVSCIRTSIKNCMEKVKEPVEKEKVKEVVKPVIEEKKEVPTFEELLKTVNNIVNENIELKKQLESLKKEIISLKDSNTNMKTEIKELKDKNESLSKKNSEKELAIQSLTRDLNTSYAEKDKMKVTYEEKLQSEINSRNSLEEHFKKQYEESLQKMNENLSLVVGKVVPLSENNKVK